MDNEDLLMVVQVTPDELIAINIAMGYYLRQQKNLSPAYDEMNQLFGQLRQRLNQQIPHDQLPPEIHWPKASGD